MLSAAALSMGTVSLLMKKGQKKTRGYSSGSFALHKPFTVASITDSSLSVSYTHLDVYKRQMKHPNVRLTTDGGKPPYIHGEPTQAVATLVFDSDIPKNAVSVKAVSTSYELLSNEDLEEIFNI